MVEVMRTWAECKAPGGSWTRIDSSPGRQVAPLGKTSVAYGEMIREGTKGKRSQERVFFDGLQRMYFVCVRIRIVSWDVAFLCSPVWSCAFSVYPHPVNVLFLVRLFCTSASASPHLWTHGLLFSCSMLRFHHSSLRFSSLSDNVLFQFSWLSTAAKV